MLAPVDRVEVTVVIDNFVDVLMAGEAGVARYQTHDFGAAEQLVAEHGFSAVVHVERDGDRQGLEVLEERAPSLLLDGAVLVSGQVERVTEFETGFPIHEARERDGWRPDPMIWDDQALVVNVRDCGLVILSGCSHAGAINVLRHAQRLAGEPRIAGFLGGLHLTGGLFEARIEPTVAALQAARVGRVLPAHCSGWRAVHAIARAMPDAFGQCAVGTTVTFEASAEDLSS